MKTFIQIILAAAAAVLLILGKGLDYNLFTLLGGFIAIGDLMWIIVNNNEDNKINFN